MFKEKYNTIFLFLMVPFLLGLQGKTEKQADVIVYGGTSAGVIAAVQIAKMGKTVVIVSPEKHLGGLSSSGLGFTDSGNKAVIGGLSREFYQRIYKFYQNPEAWQWQKKEEYGGVGQGSPAIDGVNRTMWIFEPHVAEQVFEDFVKEYKIRVYRQEFLDRAHGVVIKDGKIQSLKTLAGNIYKGIIFIDATYEGDLMAAAGVSYQVGREANSVYGEEWDGVQTGNFPIKHHDFQGLNISPFVIPDDPGSGVIPLISDKEPGLRGTGDKKIQAYCFRTCLTKVRENRIPFTRPSVYDSSRFELMIRIFNAGWRGTFRKFDPIPNLKTDVNNYGPLSFDYIGMNYDYPDASFERRKAIIKEHETYQKGLLYFIANDPQVPAEVRNEMQQWGLSKDEFRDNGNWPYQIYVREARRMVGQSVLTENEVKGKNEVHHPIGMGSYNMDSHNTQRYIKPDGFVDNEGDIEVPVPIYQIDLGTIIPKKEECTNLLVPVALSSSHIAYGTIRMEPVFMILGQSAGTVAALALENNKEINDLSYEMIRTKLIEDGQVLEYSNQTK
jgi:hypothetical protein